MPKMNKLDRMADAETIIGDLEIDATEWEAAVQAASDFNDARTEAVDGFAEAQGYHEDRAWDDRNEALETANNAVEAMAVALETLESKTDSVIIDEAELDSWHNAVRDVRKHLDNLMEV